MTTAQNITDSTTRALERAYKGTDVTVVRCPQLAVKPRAAAEILGVTPDTLARWRYVGEGPVYVKLDHGSRSVLYKISDLEDYLDAYRVVPKDHARHNASK